MVRELNEWDQSYMDITEVIAEHSKCEAKKVGCVIVKNQSIVSTGVNGTPAGYINCNDLFCRCSDGWMSTLTPNEGRSTTNRNGVKYWLSKDQEIHHKWSMKYEIHAEINALNKMIKNGISSENCTLYCNFSPCIQCCKSIISAGIKEVVFLHAYDDAFEPTSFLLDNGVMVYNI